MHLRPVCLSRVVVSNNPSYTIIAHTYHQNSLEILALFRWSNVRVLTFVSASQSISSSLSLSATCSSRRVCAQYHQTFLMLTPPQCSQPCCFHRFRHSTRDMAYLASNNSPGRRVIIPNQRSLSTTASPFYALLASLLIYAFFDESSSCDTHSLTTATVIYTTAVSLAVAHE